MMRAKFVVIAVLAAIVALVVAQMIRIEQDLRKKNTITLRIADQSAPLIEKASPRQLREHANNSRYIARCRDEHFEFLRPLIKDGRFQQQWAPFFLKGVNLGVAIPGDFPATFSAGRETYSRWLQEIGEMNANVIRVYTILPPAFYDAFAQYNLNNADKPIYLFQGVWADDPPGGNLLNPDFLLKFKREIRDAIDLIHGNATFPERPGHASGVYSSDISAWVGGIILGREWEPTFSHITNKRNSGGNYEGDFISAYQATAMEIFLASVMDFTVLYETQVYEWQRPVSFINWLTLDPLFHNSEFMLSDPTEHFDEDLESIDIRKFHASDLFKPGIFSSYHVYPYYPDFIYLGKDYKQRAGEHYKAYLEDLKTVHKGIPLVVAEYGLPNSRANSHWAPSGFDQGGHSETEQARMCGIMTRDIYNTGCAGAIFFEWIDEWFKHNWLVYDYERPGERRPLWHNVENPEQNFGIVGFWGDSRVIDGKLDDWGKSRKEFLTHHDYSYLYIGTVIPDLDFNKHDLYIAFDTHDEDRGDMKLPFGDHNAQGIEFLAHFKDTGNANVLVDDAYGGHTDIIADIRPPYRSARNSNGKFNKQTLLANRQQISLLGDTTFAWIYDRSKLKYGISSDPASSNIDWYYDPKSRVFELRLPWLVLGIGDPSSKQVHDDRPGTKACETSPTDGVRMQMFVTDKQGNVISRIPHKGANYYSWQGWDKVEVAESRKVLFDTLRTIFDEILLFDTNAAKATLPARAEIAAFHNNAPAGLSLIIGGNLSWYPEMTAKILDKFRFKACFALTPGQIGDGSTEFADRAGFRGRRMEPDQLRKLSDAGHIFCAFDPENAGKLMEMESQIGFPVPMVLNSGKSGKVNLPYYFQMSLSSPDMLKLGDNDVQTGKELLSALENRAGKPTHLYIERVDPPMVWTAPMWSEVNVERVVRIARNSGYWVTTPTELNNYIRSRDAVKLVSESRGNTVFLRLAQTRPIDKPHPLTVVFYSDASKVRVSNSVTDGVHQVRQGRIMFDAMPGSQIILEIIE